MRPLSPRTVTLLSATFLAFLLTACGSQPPAPEQNPSGVESRSPSVIETTPIPLPQRHQAKQSTLSA